VNNQSGDTGFVKMDMLEKTFEPAMHGQCFGAGINMIRKTPQTDGSGLDNHCKQPDKRFTSCPPQKNMVIKRQG
jgi:hypothetical protein